MERNSKPIKGQAEEEEEQPWKPYDLEVDPERQARLMQEMEVSMKTIQNSSFYASFLNQLKCPKLSKRLRRALGTETQLQMVIYGIGSIECSKASRFQLSIAILMSKEFDWVGDHIEVFDPVLSATECNVLKSLGCTVLHVNEHARRVALKPTLFFMPHCHIDLYNNLLLANWSMERLSKVVLLGNSLWIYERDAVFLSPRFMDLINPIVNARKITAEFAIKTGMPHSSEAFGGLSWHFFSPGHRLRAANVGLRGISYGNPRLYLLLLCFFLFLVLLSATQSKTRRQSFT